MVGVDQIKRAERRLNDDLAKPLLIGVQPVKAFERLLDGNLTIAIAVELPQQIPAAADQLAMKLLILGLF